MRYWKPSELWSKLAELNYASPEVYDETIKANLNRLVYLALLAVPMNIIFIAMFWMRSVDSVELQRWRELVILSHASLMITLISGAVLCRIFARRNALRPAAEMLQYVVAALFLSFGVALSVADQLVTPSITPFIVAGVTSAVVLLLKPLASVPIYIGATALIYWRLGVYQDDPALLLTGRVNALTVAVLCIILSTILWNSYVSRFSQQLRLEKQQLELEQMNSKLHFIATHDEMTGLVNRKELLRLAQDEIARMHRYGTKTSIILTDIDRFKSFNDRFGHPAGDVIIVQFAELLRKAMRAVDVVARWGGEEFLILLPETDLTGGLEAAERLRGAVESHELSSGDVTIRLTASFGVAELSEKAEDPFGAAYEAADRALYRAKETGRNRVEVELNR